jgi:hypothetical protein
VYLNEVSLNEDVDDGRGVKLDARVVDEELRELERGLRVDADDPLQQEGPY